jgi:Xaa-Pro aminopeptidase
MQKKLTGNLLLIGSPEIDADIRYITGFFAPDPLVYIELCGERFMITSTMEADRARKEAKADITVVTPIELEMHGRKKYSIVDCIKKIMQQKKEHTISVTEKCPVGVVESLRKARLKVVVLKKSPLISSRAIKSPTEISCIKKAQKVAVFSLKHIVQFIKEAKVNYDGALLYNDKPLTSEFLRTELVKFQANYGCRSSGTIIACGKETANPHWAGYGKLYADKPIIIDIFPQDERSGYWGDLTRTVIKGEASPLLKAMYQAVLMAQRAVLSSIEAGVNARFLHRKACDVLQKYGFRTMSINGKMQGFIHSTGHGVGMSIHEYPTIGNADIKLEAGNIVTIEPGLYYHRIGGIRIEDTVLVTKSGYEMLYSAPHYFII